MGALSNLLFQIHWAIIAYAVFNVYNIYEEKDLKLNQEKERIPVIQAKIKKKEKELKVLLAYEEKIIQKKKELELAADEVAKLQKKFPSDVNDPENLAMIKDIADGLNIKNPDMSSLKEENKGFYFIKKYKFSAKATFLQFLILFEKISENERLFNIYELSMKTAKDKQRGRFQLIDGEFIIESYRYNKNYRNNLKIKQTKKNKRRKKSKRRSRRKKKK